MRRGPNPVIPKPVLVTSLLLIGYVLALVLSSRYLVTISQVGASGSYTVQFEVTAPSYQDGLHSTASCYYSPCTELGWDWVVVILAIQSVRVTVNSRTQNCPVILKGTDEDMTTKNSASTVPDKA